MATALGDWPDWGARRFMGSVVWGIIRRAMAIHVFGLTGGIATGKSTVAARWRQHGLPVVDADELAREVVYPGSAGLAAVIQLMGRQVVLADGTLDRALVASRVFGDSEARRSLEAVIHPRIQEALQLRIQALDGQGEALVCYEAPLLVEVGRAHLYRPLVIVVSSETVQLQQAFMRDRQNEAAVRARIASQLPTAQKSTLADIVMSNDGTLEQLNIQADGTLAEICRKFDIDPSRYGL